MSPKKPLIYRSRVGNIFRSLLAILILSTIVSTGKSDQSFAASDCSDVFTPLSSFVINGVNANKGFYENVMNQTGVPWEMLAAIHYRETNFSHTNPSNGQGIFQFVNGDGGPYPTGPVSDAEFSRQLMFMANKLQSSYALRNSPNAASISPRRLTANEQDVTLVKNTLYSYNGRATAYANQATQYGYNATTQPYEGSPYVMNRYDCNRARMGIITKDYASGIDGTDTRYGAFTIFARLRGDNYWLSSFSPYAWHGVSQEAYSNAARTSGFSLTTTVTPGGKLYMRVKARNIGSHAWSNSTMRLGTSSPQDRRSGFEDVSWVNPTRPSNLLETTVEPGQIGTFDFVLQGHANTGSYREYFNLVNDGVTWLNNPGLYFPINIVSTIAPRNTTSSELSSENVLKKGDTFLSPDTQSALTLQNDGNLVYYSSLRAVWSSNTAGKNSEKLIMQPDGNLVLYDTNNAPLWYSGTSATSGEAKLRLQTDGNVVIYNQAQQPLWSLGYSNNPNLLSTTTTTMQTSRLFTGQYMETADRRYQLTLQPDGNLVLYSQARPIWSTMTIGDNRPAYLRLQEDGNLVLYTKTGQPVWSSHTEGRGLSRMVIQEDGNLVLYNNTSSTWWSNTIGR